MGFDNQLLELVHSSALLLKFWGVSRQGKGTHFSWHSNLFFTSSLTRLYFHRNKTSPWNYSSSSFSLYMHWAWAMAVHLNGQSLIWEWCLIKILLGRKVFRRKPFLDKVKLKRLHTIRWALYSEFSQYIAKSNENRSLKFSLFICRKNQLAA